MTLHALRATALETRKVPSDQDPKLCTFTSRSQSLSAISPTLVVEGSWPRVVLDADPDGYQKARDHAASRSGLFVFLFPGAIALPDDHLENLRFAAFRPIPGAVVLELLGYHIVEVGFRVSGHTDVDAHLVGA